MVILMKVKNIQLKFDKQNKKKNKITFKNNFPFFIHFSYTLKFK
jgi:hypothetical protein